MNNSEHSLESEYTGCVLVVDDNDRVRQMLSLALVTAGFDVFAADTHKQAQYQLAHTRPDALVLNLQRSQADGLEVLLQMRARHDLSKVPIVFLAGCDSEDFHWQAIRAGADWFGLRPLGMVELQKRVQQLIRQGRPRLKMIAAGDPRLRSHPLELTG